MTQGDFTIQPVGQGLFYAGKIGQAFNLVYDCGRGTHSTVGTDSDFALLISNYKRHELINDTIDMLVVSHFDSDHANGLFLLLSGKTIVKQLFIPYSGIGDYLILFSLLYITGATSRVEKISLVLEKTAVNDDESNSDDNSIGISLDLDSKYTEPDLIKKISIMPSSTVVSSQQQWLFKFYNMQKSKATISRIENEFDALLKINKCNTIQDLLKLKEGLHPTKKTKHYMKTLIREIYKNSLKRLGKDSINKSSLCLYHKPINSDKAVCFDYPSSFCNENSENVGAMLTGDINLSDDVRANEFLRFFKNELSETYFMFLPHHGSYLNWNDLLFNYLDKNTVFIVSAGKNNKYGHPSSTLISKLFKRGNLIGVATEQRLIKCLIN
ncbi:hypothetical protein IGJ66_002393 [Enterococcus sp. DIV0176]|uniref:hypothetical protein n=1 Tax=Enterococcus sp. DIV0176 TaxID=2774758 RepID=UPI003D2FFB4E